MIFNLPDYRVTATVVLPEGARHVTVESTFPPGCPNCGVSTSRVKERRCQRLRDIPVAGAVVLLWDKRRWFCDEYLCQRKSFCEATPQVPRRARSTRRLRETVLDAVIDSGPGCVRDRHGIGDVVVAGPVGHRRRRSPAAGCGSPCTQDAGYR